MDKREKQVVSDGGYGWIVVVATIIINVTLLPLIQCFGILFKNELSIMNVTAAQISFLLHLQSSIYCSLGVISTPLLKKYSYRQVSLLGASLMSTGVLLTSFANSYTFLIFSVSILMGIGQGILIPATYVATNSYFKKRLTIAVSLSVTGASLSPIFMPKICDIILSNLGLRYAVLILFFISLLSIPSCLLLKPVKVSNVREEEKIAEVRDDPDIKMDVAVTDTLLKIENDAPYNKPTTIKAKQEKQTIFQKIYDIFDLDLLKDRPYVMVVLGLGISFASELNIIIMIQFILYELCGFGSTDVALAASIQSITDVIGRLAIPILTHMCHISPKIMYSLSLLTSIASRTGLALFFDSRIAVFICCALLGLGKGSKAVYQSVIIPKYVTLEKLPAATGLNMLFTGTVSLLIGPIIGSIHDVSKTYIYALHAATALSLLCIFMWILEYVITRKKPEN